VETERQFARYAVIGVATNLGMFLLYLLLTADLLGPKSAMSVTFIAGVLSSFVLNRNWTFRDRGATAGSLSRYVFAYATAYVFNYASLALFADKLGFPHVHVQGLAILTIAVYLFVLQKVWVFRNKGDRTRPAPTAPVGGGDGP